MKRISLWVPVATMLLVSLISYIDRNTLAVLAPTIKQDAGLSSEEYGWIVTAFSFAYMLSNPLWGGILDRWGIRLGMIVAVTLWTAASTSHAFATTMLGFAVARAALGFGEGATFPGGLRTAVQTLPPEKRARGIAVAYSGGSLGAIVTPPIVRQIVAWWHWRAAFLFTGLIGVAWLGVWSIVSRRPDVKRLPEKSATESSDKLMRVRDLRLWSFALLYALGALPIAFVIYLAPIYLNEGLGASQDLILGYIWLPPLGWEIGYFFWGWLADRAKRASEDRAPALRRLMLTVTVLSLPLAAGPFLGSFPLVMAELVLAMFCASGFIILSIAYATDVYSSRYAAFISGLSSGSWSATVALLMPVFGRLLDQTRYDLAFGLATLCPVVGYLIWRGVQSVSVR